MIPKPYGQQLKIQLQLSLNITLFSLDQPGKVMPVGMCIPHANNLKPSPSRIMIYDKAM